MNIGEEIKLNVYELYNLYYSRVSLQLIK